MATKNRDETDPKSTHFQNGEAAEEGTRRAPGKPRRGILLGALVIAALLAVCGMLAGVIGMASPDQQPPAATASYSPAPTVQAPFTAAPGGVVPTEKPFPVDVGGSRVVIASAGIDQTVKDISLDQGGVLHPPTDSVGWFVQSAPITSEAGSTVLAGHINTDSNGPGPFAGLATVKAGDPVVTTTAEGTPVKWRIVSAENYDKDKLPATLFDTTAGARQLVLITCGGNVTGKVPGTNLPTFDMNTVIVAVPA